MNEKQIPVPSREQVVHQQLQALLNVAGVMSQIVKCDAEAYTGGSLDGGAKMAAEQTLVKACQRMDLILDAPSAWDMSGYDGLINHLNIIYTAHRDLLKQQSESVSAMDRPSRRYSPVLVKIAPGQWVAVLGHLTDLDNSIVGLGASPEAALSEFDNSFKGIASKEVLEWAAAYAEAIEAGTTLPEHPSLNKNQNESPKQMEHGGNSPRNQSSQKRKNIRPDSGDSRSKQDGDSSEA